MIDTQALLLTLRLAAFTSALLLLPAVPLAAWLVLGQGRWRAPVQACAMLPVVLPPTVLGYYLLVLLGPRTGFGRACAAVLGHPLAFSFSGLLVGSVIYSLPFALQPLVAGFGQVPVELQEAALVLGESRFGVLLRVVLPLSRQAVLASALLTFAHTVGEFGIVLMIGGDIPGATRTLSIALLDQVENFQYAAANRTALGLLLLSFTVLAAVYGLGSRARQP